MSVGRVEEEIAGQPIGVPELLGLAEILGLVHIRRRPAGVNIEDDEHEKDFDRGLPARHAVFRCFMRCELRTNRRLQESQRVDAFVHNSTIHDVPFHTQWRHVPLTCNSLTRLCVLENFTFLS